MQGHLRRYIVESDLEGHPDNITNFSQAAEPERFQLKKDNIGLSQDFSPL